MADEFTESNNLTYEKMMAVKRSFDQSVREIKAESALAGLCICDNCFGDRCMLAWPGICHRRNCLAEPFLLTDLGPNVSRHHI